jgi:serine/threonine protein phosphatase 1
MIYAIGDIHGCHDQLLVLLAKIKAHAGNRPSLGVFLGDYVDRGPKSRNVVNQVIGLCSSKRGESAVKWHAIKGNHEEMMVANLALPDITDHWICNGGGTTVASYAKHEEQMQAHGKWMAKLPSHFETEHYYFVHAGISPRYKLGEQPEEVKLWIRNWQGDDPDMGKHIVYGHSPEKKPRLMAHSTGLDTGAFYWGTLTCGVFDETKAAGPVDILEAK